AGAAAGAGGTGRAGRRLGRRRGVNRALAPPGATPLRPPTPAGYEGAPMPAAPAVLLTDARWRKAISAVRALGRRGVRVLTCDATRLVAAAVSRYVERHLVLPAPARDPEGFVAAVARLAEGEQV